MKPWSPRPSWILCLKKQQQQEKQKKEEKKHTTNFGRQCSDCWWKTPGAVLAWLSPLPILCRRTATVYQSTHTHRYTHNQQLPKILTAQISTPTLEVVKKGRADWKAPGKNCSISRNENDSTQRGQTAACYLKRGSDVRVALLSQDVLILRLFAWRNQTRWT